MISDMCFILFYFSYHTSLKICEPKQCVSKIFSNIHYIPVGVLDPELC